MEDIELLKLKMKYNYTLARLHKGELYLATDELDFLEKSPEQQKKIIDFLQDLSIGLLILKKDIEKYLNRVLEKTEEENGFLD